MPLGEGLVGEKPLDSLAEHSSVELDRPTGITRPPADGARDDEVERLPQAWLGDGTQEPPRRSGAEGDKWDEEVRLVGEHVLRAHVPLYPAIDEHRLDPVECYARILHMLQHVRAERDVEPAADHRIELLDTDSQVGHCSFHGRFELLRSLLNSSLTDSAT